MTVECLMKRIEELRDAEGSKRQVVAGVALYEARITLQVMREALCENQQLRLENQRLLNINIQIDEAIEKAIKERSAQ
jgi:hypothetical protein